MWFALCESTFGEMAPTFSGPREISTSSLDNLFADQDPRNLCSWKEQFSTSDIRHRRRRRPTFYGRRRHPRLVIYFSDCENLEIDSDSTIEKSFRELFVGRQKPRNRPRFKNERFFENFEVPPTGNYRGMFFPRLSAFSPFFRRFCS